MKRKETRLYNVVFPIWFLVVAWPIFTSYLPQLFLHRPGDRLAQKRGIVAAPVVFEPVDPPLHPLGIDPGRGHRLAAARHPLADALRRRLAAGAEARRLRRRAAGAEPARIRQGFSAEKTVVGEQQAQRPFLPVSRRHTPPPTGSAGCCTGGYAGWRPPSGPPPGRSPG